MISPVPPHFPLYKPGTSEEVGMSKEFKIVEARVDKNRLPRERSTGTLDSIVVALDRTLLVANGQAVILKVRTEAQRSQN